MFDSAELNSCQYDFESVPIMIAIHLGLDQGE